MVVRPISSLFLCRLMHSPNKGLNIGGQLLTSLHSRTSHGDPFIRNFSSHLLTELSVPFFATMSSWIYEGELKDPFNEFFVMYDNEFDDDEGESYEGRGRGEEELWKGKFKFRKEMLPGFLEEAFGRKVGFYPSQTSLVYYPSLY